MALIQRAAVPTVADLHRETVTVSALGGDVLVSELSLEDRLEFEELLREDSRTKAEKAGTKADKPATKARTMLMVPHLLARTVLAADGEPLFTVEQWRAWGARNRDAAIELFNTAMRVSGFNGDDAKKN